MEIRALCALMLLSSACSTRPITAPPASPPTGEPAVTVPELPAVSSARVSIGGWTKGLRGGLVLALDEGETLTIGEDGPFAFTTLGVPGARYAVTIAAQPGGQTCTPFNASGTLGTDPIHDVEILCTTLTMTSYSVGGNVSGLAGRLVLTNNGGDDLELTSGGEFVFPTLLASGSLYDVRIKAQPDGQHCSVARGADRVLGRDVTQVSVTCVDARCINLGWKSGGADWSCPSGFRLPAKDEYTWVAPCIDRADSGRFSSYADIAVSIEGCGCAWNIDWCEEPSIETMRQGRACGDYSQLHVCIAE